MPTDVAALDNVDLRPRVLRYSLRSLPPDASCGDVSALLAALLGLPPVDRRQSRDEQPAQRPWCSDPAVGDADLQLQALLRGDDLHACNCRLNADG